jgi:hypothetical protein
MRSYTIWTRRDYTGEGFGEYVVVSSVPGYALAERIVENIKAIYGDDTLYIEED